MLYQESKSLIYMISFVISHRLEVFSKNLSNIFFFRDKFCEVCLCIMFFCRSSFENSRNNFYGILILSLNVLKKERKTERTKKKLLPCNADQFFSNSVAFTPACKTLVILVQGEIQ